MSTLPRPIRLVAATATALAVAAGFLIFGPVGAAFAATPTNIALASIPSIPTAGSAVTMQAYVIATDGTTPAGSVNVSVEGDSFIVGAPINTTTHIVQFNIGNFKRGSIVVDASFTPSNPAYASATTHTTVAITGLTTLSIRPGFLDPLVVGTPVPAVALMTVTSGTAYAPGGVVGFTITGTTTSIGTCTPAATGTSHNFSCSVTLPAPTATGTYAVTATLGRSDYYLDASGNTTGTSTAPPKAAAPAPVKKAAAAPVPVATATPTPAAIALPTPTATETPHAGPATADALTSAPKQAPSAPADPWAWLFLIAIVLLIAAIVAIILVLRRRRAVAPPAS